MDQEDTRSIDQRLRDAGYSHCRANGSHYLHTIWRTDDGAMAGYFSAQGACELLARIGG